MERTHVITDMKIKFEGLFDFKELFQMVDKWILDAGYEKVEKMNYEKMKPEGKHIEIELEPEKKISDYVKFQQRIKFLLKNVKKVVVSIDEKKKELHEGIIEIKFNSFVYTDYENKLENIPLLMMMRFVFEKLFYKSKMKHYDELVEKDTKELYDEIKAFLNLTSKRF